MRKLTVKTLKDALKDLPEDLEIAVYAGALHYDYLSEIKIVELGEKNYKLVDKMISKTPDSVRQYLVLE